MEKQGKKIKGTVENMIKPVSTMIERFNYFMKKLEEKTTVSENTTTVDGFVNELIEELQDVEQGIFAFFTELLFMHHLSERMTEIENEVTLCEILGERLKESLKPDFIEVFLANEEEMLFSSYSFPDEKMGETSELEDMAREVFSKKESLLYNNKRILHGTFSVLAVPLRTTRDNFGTLLVGRQSPGRFSSEDITLAISGSAVVSFMTANIKLMQKIIRDKQLVMIGETVGGLSHDVRNFLNNLENGISLVGMGIEDNDRESLDLGLKVMKTGYEKLKNFILSMIEYSKERALNPQEVDINRLVGSLISTHSGTFNYKDVEIRTDLDNSLGKIMLDPMLMERILVNLIQNAVDAVEEKGGVVTVETGLSENGKTLILKVRDNGHGIPEEQAGRIFDIFYSTKGSRGTGFGLAIVEKAVKTHNGKIEFSTRVGEGTTFEVTIPV